MPETVSLSSDFPFTRPCSLTINGRQQYYPACGPLSILGNDIYFGKHPADGPEFMTFLTQKGIASIVNLAEPLSSLCADYTLFE